MDDAKQSPPDEAVIPSRALRNLLGRYPTGVAIVSTRTQEGAAIGLTINSFVSLSMDPPLVAWSLVDSSPRLEAFRDCRLFGISILASTQEDVARRFATAGVHDKFAGVDLLQTASGVPLIAGAVASLVCASHQSFHIGDHLLLVGRVVRVDDHPGSPLVFHRGQFLFL